MQVERQLIPVKDGDPDEAELKFTRHGPVIYEDTQKNIAFAVRAAWLEPGTAPYLGSVAYMRAEDWDGFLAAMNRWGAPGENQVPRSLPKPGDPGRSVTDDQAVGSGVSDRDEARRKYTKHASIES